LPSLAERGFQKFQTFRHQRVKSLSVTLERFFQLLKPGPEIVGSFVELVRLTEYTGGVLDRQPPIRLLDQFHHNASEHSELAAKSVGLLRGLVLVRLGATLILADRLLREGNHC
jgi:hypothetical protein